MIHDSLQAEGKALPLISIIIPVYNTQDYIKLCIQSVLDQTYPNFEILCVDDGSTDKSADIIRLMMCQDSRIRLLQIENHGQGYARNYALDHANGEFIMFLDADDYIERVTLDVAAARLQKDASDLVVFDWRFYNPIGQTSNYCNQDSFFGKSILMGTECLALLNVDGFFSVNKVYRKSFLDNHGIRYGEKYLYEDNPFCVHVATCAEKVSLIHAPLYRITTHQASSTKTGHDTDIHSRSFIHATEKSIEIFERHAGNTVAKARYDFARYFLKKFRIYYRTRVPKSEKAKFLRQFVDLLSGFDFEDFHESSFITACLKRDVFKKKKYGQFILLIRCADVLKPVLVKDKEKIKAFLKKLRNKLKRAKYKLLRKPVPATPQQKYTWYVKQALYQDVILFEGFDYRYTGNSRYLFEEMLKHAPDRKKLFFVTDDPRVPLQHRLEPKSDRHYRFLARSKVVIFESWIPEYYKRQNGAIWIQLWHGTPLKKMLYDSHEPMIHAKRPDSKNRKYADIARWNYLLVDSPEICSYFETAFLFPRDHMLPMGYPRVQYLLSHKNDADYKLGLRKMYNIEPDKKVVLYLPTWRDYNYQAEQGAFDTDYILDMKALQSRLGDQYEIVYKDHVYLSKPENVDFRNFSDAETQELMLIADYLITDYSSAMFDAFAIDLPVILYCNDVEKNENSRGVYPGMWQDLQPLVCDGIDGIVSMIENCKEMQQYQLLKEKYSYRPAGDVCLPDFIAKL